MINRKLFSALCLAQDEARVAHRRYDNANKLLRAAHDRLLYVLGEVRSANPDLYLRLMREQGMKRNDVR